MNLTRRNTLQLTLAGLAAAGVPKSVLAASHSGSLTIAYNVNLPAFDPTTVGLSSAVNPTIQGFFQSIFDHVSSARSPDLSSLRPGILTDWGWTDDRISRST